mgnify:CR=1 FL=1
MPKHRYKEPVTYYDILQVRQDATPKSLKKAYWRLARDVHPDLYKNKTRIRAEKRLKQINIAYNCLKNRRNRELYDLQLKARKKPVTPRFSRKAVNDNSGHHKSLFYNWTSRIMDNISEIFWPLSKDTENVKSRKIK